MTPAQALSAATAHTASAFGLADRGRIRAGLRADLVLVDGDPSADILATRSIVKVWKNGFDVQRTVNALLAQKVSDEPQIGNFDGAEISAPFGAWMASTDQMADGKSTGAIKLAIGGAGASAGALHITGKINAGFAYPWSGAMFMAADAMAPLDASAKTEIVFQVRGDGREYRVMLFSGETIGTIPVMQYFKTTTDWQEVKIPLADFNGADLANLRGLAWTADAPEGAFEFWIDEVELR
jgi:Complex I intermediate-associated protein 30 (CIA30)/Amidohydrolase family